MKDGDKIVVDAENRTIDWLVDDDVKAERAKEWETSGKRPLTVRRGILYRYARDVAVSLVSLICLTVAILTCRESLQAKAHTVIECCNAILQSAWG